MVRRGLDRLTIELADVQAELAARRRADERKVYHPDQPRVSAGNPTAGSGQAGLSVAVATSTAEPLGPAIRGQGLHPRGKLLATQVLIQSEYGRSTPRTAATPVLNILRLNVLRKCFKIR